MPASRVDSPHAAAPSGDCEVEPEPVHSSSLPPQGQTAGARRRLAQRFQRTAQRIARSAQLIELRRFEGRTVMGCARELVPRLLPCIDEGLALACAVQEGFESRAQRGGTLDESGVRDMEPSEPQSGGSPSEPATRQCEAAVRAAGLAFVIGLQLRERRERLTTLVASEHRDALLEVASSAQRRLFRSLEALEGVLAPLSGLPCELSQGTGLERSLRSRRAYAALRAQVGSEAPPDASQVWPRLLQVGAHLRELMGAPVYGQLRLSDRREMERLELRIRREHSLGVDVTTGLRLWGDLVGFVDLLTQINRRQELVVHDSAQALQALRELDAALGVSAPVRARAERLRGASPELDQVLDAGTWDRAALCAALLEVAQRGCASTLVH